MSDSYHPLRPGASHHLPVRGLHYHLHQWGTPQPGVPLLVMVHGFMDVGASFQFVVDAMAQDRWVIAPDWRGYGLSASARIHWGGWPVSCPTMAACSGGRRRAPCSTSWRSRRGTGRASVYSRTMALVPW